jgi:hypothetical protein
MSGDNHDKIMEKLGAIHTDVAVLKEKFKKVDQLETRVDKVEKKITFHDKVVGSVVLASSIIVALIKYGKL